jgi:hypothetical protein
MSLFRSIFPDYINKNIMYYIGKFQCFTQYYINTDFTADKINGRIFIGDLASASNNQELKKNGVTHIVSVLNGAYEIFPDEFSYKIIHINDDPWVKISKYFEETNKYIENALNESPNNKVFIHCRKGISRSVTILMAYLIYEKYVSKNLKESDVDDIVSNILTEIRLVHEIAKPNDGFIQILKDYIKENYKL